jgi:predicted metal-dependent phosphoesterase TrpH
MIHVEFHCHTQFSKDSLTHIHDLLRVCKQRGVDRIVITDHNTIQGSVKAAELDPQMVIIGEEIQTTEGELLAAFVKDEVPEGLHPMDAIRILREQGAFISVSHPFDYARKGAWRMEALVAIAPMVDALEVFNARCWNRGSNNEALKFAQKYGLAGTAGSDAHSLYEVGRSGVLLPEFDDTISLKRVLPAGVILARHSPYWVHLTSRYAVWRKHVRGLDAD